MESLSTLLGLAVVLFVSTNVDDLVLLIAFFANSSFRPRDVVAGQYAGIAVLFVVSAAGTLLSFVIPQAYLGLLGFFPILVGAKNFWSCAMNPPERLRRTHSAKQTAVMETSPVWPSWPSQMAATTSVFICLPLLSIPAARSPSSRWYSSL